MLQKRSQQSNTNRAKDIALVSMFENYQDFVFFQFLSALDAQRIFISPLYMKCHLHRKSSIAFGCFNVGLY
jgi:hypothetical protein